MFRNGLQIGMDVTIQMMEYGVMLVHHESGVVVDMKAILLILIQDIALKTLQPVLFIRLALDSEN